MSISRFLSSYQFEPLTNNEVTHGPDGQKHISDEHFPQEIVPAPQIAPNDDGHLKEEQFILFFSHLLLDYKLSAWIQVDF